MNNKFSYPCLLLLVSCVLCGSLLCFSVDSRQKLQAKVHPDQPLQSLQFLPAENTDSPTTATPPPSSTNQIIFELAFSHKSSASSRSKEPSYMCAGASR